MPEITARPPERSDPYFLPDGRAIAHARAQETDKLYRDIFVERIYLQHGLALPEGSVVIDAGANIGLFTLFVLQTCPTASVFCVEPAPRTFELLRQNTAAFPAVKLLQYGVGAENGELEFTFFPNLTCGSGFYDEDQMRRIKDIRRSLILADPKRASELNNPVGEELIEYLIDRNLQREVTRIPVRPLSAILDQAGIRDLDLLKLDVEGSELPALRSVRPDQWPGIRQVVIEVHNTKGHGPELISILQGQGFETHLVHAPLYEIGGKSMLYARRTGA